jgi:hypothetical protein
MLDSLEQWRPTAYPNFWVSSFGRVRRDAYTLTRSDGQTRKMPTRFFGGNLSPNGYLYVSLKPHRDAAAVHALVASAFLCEKPKSARTVNHKDGNKLNNRLENLEWATYQENNRHARKLLLNRQHGERCNLTKYSDDVVDAVRILADSGRFTAAEVAAFFGMSASHVFEIKNHVSRAVKTAENQP